MGAKSPEPVRRLAYCFSSGISPFREDREEANAGLEEVPGLLEEARRQGIDVEEVDLSKQDEEKRRALYEQAAAAARRSRLQNPQDSSASVGADTGPISAGRCRLFWSIGERSASRLRCIRAVRRAG
jgi:hypothetical protein